MLHGEKMSEPKTVWVGKSFGKEPKYACKHCNARFDKPQSLGAHVTARHSSIMGEEVLQYYIGVRRNLKENGEPCPYCGQRFYTTRTFANHIIDSHKKEVEANIAKMKTHQEQMKLTKDAEGY